MPRRARRGPARAGRRDRAAAAPRGHGRAAHRRRRHLRLRGRLPGHPRPGATDQAAFTVPLDAACRPALPWCAPTTPHAPAALRADLPGADRGPVLRLSGPRRIQASVGTPVQMLGPDPATLPAMTRWSRTVGGPDPSSVASSLRVGPLPQGTALPAGRRVSHRHPRLAGRGRCDRHRSGRRWPGAERRAEVSDGGTAGGALVLRICLDFDGARLVALTLRLPFDEETRRIHGLGEGSVDRATRRPHRTRRRDRRRPSGGAALAGLVRDRLQRAGTRRLAALDYQLAPGRPRAHRADRGPGRRERSGARGRGPRHRGAARDGLLDLRITGPTSAPRVVAVLPRFPTLDGPFAILDLGALARLVDVSSPGTAEPIELWISAPRLARRAGRAAVRPAVRTGWPCSSGRRSRPRCARIRSPAAPPTCSPGRPRRPSSPAPPR